MTSILIYLVLFLAVIALIQVVRVFEISNILKGEDGITVSDKQTNNIRYAWVAFIAGYFAFVIWILYKFGGYMLPEAASEHGAQIDTLMDANMAIIMIVFVITHIILGVFVFKYAKTQVKEASYITHDNRLELIWTAVPSIVLAVIIIFGISTWESAMREVPEDAINVELYARQFDWTARYAGEDNILGKANFRMIGGTNSLGIINESTISERLSQYDEKINSLEESRKDVFPGSANDEAILESIKLQKKNRAYVEQLKAQNEIESYSVADDDVLTKVEFHIPVGKPVNFQIRSQDVIHSAYMPHFRAQMNAVPGMMTQFYFTPTITTSEMRGKLGNPDFNYLLYCNKICGSAHYNMQMTIVVESEADYKKWLAEQPKFYTASK
ncbi:MAG: cytochrome c oxidase subunit II [Salibacteraceae bacterium]